MGNVLGGSPCWAAASVGWGPVLGHSLCWVEARIGTIHPVLVFIQILYGHYFSMGDSCALCHWDHEYDCKECGCTLHSTAQGDLE